MSVFFLSASDYSPVDKRQISAPSTIVSVFFFWRRLVIESHVFESYKFRGPELQSVEQLSQFLLKGLQAMLNCPRSQSWPITACIYSASTHESTQIKIANRKQLTEIANRDSFSYSAVQRSSPTKGLKLKGCQFMYAKIQMSCAEVRQRSSARLYGPVLALLLSLFSLSQPITVHASALIPAPPKLAAKSYVLMDADTGKIIVQKCP